MITIKMTIELDLPDVYGEDEDEIKWLKEEIIIPNDMVIISSEIGDELGVIKSITGLTIKTKSYENK